MEETQPPQTLDTPHRHISKIMIFLFIFSLIVAGISMFVAYQSLQQVKLLETQMNDKPKPSTQSPTITNTPYSSVDQANLETFTDPNIEGMSFTYDPNQWSVKRDTDQSVTLSEKNSSGVLNLIYNLPFGTGVGYSPFKIADITVVTANIRRMKVDNNVYDYGKDSALRYFADSPEELARMKAFCKPDYQGMRPFAVQECPDIESGKVDGYAIQPVFSRSLRFKILTSLKDINPQWANDDYVKSEGLDNGYILVTTTYTGDNPEAADEIVKQLKF